VRLPAAGPGVGSGAVGPGTRSWGAVPARRGAWHHRPFGIPAGPSAGGAGQHAVGGEQVVDPLAGAKLHPGPATSKMRSSWPPAPAEAQPVRGTAATDTPFGGRASQGHAGRKSLPGQLESSHRHRSSRATSSSAGRRARARGQRELRCCPPDKLPGLPVQGPGDVQLGPAGFALGLVESAVRLRVRCSISDVRGGIGSCKAALVSWATNSDGKAMAVQARRTGPRGGAGPPSTVFSTAPPVGGTARRTAQVASMRALARRRFGRPRGGQHGQGGGAPPQRCTRRHKRQLCFPRLAACPRPMARRCVLYSLWLFLLKRPGGPCPVTSQGIRHQGVHTGKSQRRGPAVPRGGAAGPAPGSVEGKGQ